LTFIDNLPIGLEIADPSGVDTDCTGGILTAASGSSVISYGPAFAGDASVAANSACAVTVDVVGASVGPHSNSTSDLTSTTGASERSSGKANAALEVTAYKVHLIKSFTDDPVPPDGTVTTQFTITNFSREDSATDIIFTDDLSAMLAGLVAVGLPLAEPCGAGSLLTGTSLLALAGGNLGPGDSCTFTTTLQLPGTAAGIFTNTTSSITADVGGTGVVGAPGSDDLFVQALPILTKEFIDDPVGPGGNAMLRFTIVNADATSDATDIAFEDIFKEVLPTASSIPADGFCGAGSHAEFSPLTSPAPPSDTVPAKLVVTGATLAPGSSCSFDMTLDVAEGAPGGDYVNTTSAITATINGGPVVGNRASDTLIVIEGPQLTKEFTDDPVASGGIATLQFTIIYGDEETVGDAVDITFTDDLDGVIAGLAATGLPMNDVCGLGSQISGTDRLSFTGGSLTPGSSCTFSVPVQVPATASPGSHTNTTSDMTASVLGVSTVGAAAEDDLQVLGLALTKEFTNDPVQAGGTVTLAFTITNATADLNATNISFSDNLDDSLTGLVATGLPLADICGAGSGLTGASVLMFNGGSLNAGESCTFSVTLQVPVNAASDFYNNTTSSLLATFVETPTLLPPATDTLIVASDLLRLDKAFVEDSASPGDTVTLGFTVTNLNATQSASNITFTDDLDAALAGLTAVGLPADDVCGIGSQVTGTSLLTLTGGNLGPGASCNFNVTLQLPTAIAFGASIDNATSEATGTSAGLPVTADPASDSLPIDFLDFNKSFAGPTSAGGTPMLTFTIQNLSDSATISDLAFSDDLDATLSGLTATGLPASNLCGAGSQLAGTSFLTMTGGNLGPGGSCTFHVALLVPAAAPAGSFINTTSNLSSAGISVAEPASDTLVVFEPPEFSKRFAPDVIALNETGRLTFTIDNTANVLPADNLDLTDNFPAGIVIAATPNASTDCTGGVLIAAGTLVVDYSGGSVAAGASCTVQVDVTGASVGSHLNTSADLTSSLGNSGSASDTLTVEVLAFDKSFLPAVIGVGSVSTLTFEIVNFSGDPVSALSFTDNLPAGVTIAAPANASSTCGGTVSAPNGGSTIELTAGGVGAAAGSCLVTVDVTGSIADLYTNVTSQLQTSDGNVQPATAGLLVSFDRPGFTKSFSPSSVAFGARSKLTFTINNSQNEGSAATGLDFTDNLPAGIVIAAPANASTACSGGVLTAVSGTDVVSYTQGSIGALASCTITVDVIGGAVGLLGNTTGELTSNLGPSGKASAVLEVTGSAISLIKSFTDDPVPPGSTATVEFVIANFNRDESATNITFTDDLSATLSGLVAVGLPLSDVCGSGSTLSGTSLLTLSGASLGPGESCTFSTTLQVPAGAATGVYKNTTSSITADVGGRSITGTPGSDDLFVQTTPMLTKSFTDDPVGAGGAVNLNFNIQNTSTTSSAINIAFTDNLDLALSGLTVDSLPANGFCGAGSSLTSQLIDDQRTLIMTGGNLPAGGSCGFDVTLLVPAGAAGGAFTNTTSEMTAVVDGISLIASQASDNLVVLGAPQLTKEFTNNPVLPGENANLEFTLTYPSEGGASDATNINFTDNLNAALTGLAAVGLPLNDICGVGSTLSGTTNLSFTGGSLSAGSSCTFSIPVKVPLESLPGSFTNETSNVTATVDGVTTMGAPATGDLQVAGLAISKEFTDDPVPAGGTVTLQFTIDNVSQVADATNITFTDNLDETLTGLVATGTPLSDVCGTGSQLTGTSTLELTGGNLMAGESCTFSVTLQVPAAAASDMYVNTTSNLNAQIGDTTVSLEPATDTLIVASGLLLLDKAFVEDSASAGDTVTLDFTITNLDASQSVTGITFTDDLDAALAGLVFVGLPASNACGAGSQLTGTSLLTLTGGTLGPGASCSFSTTLQLPANIPFGSVISNTTSQATGDLGGLQVTADPASDDLQIDFFKFSKSFDGLTYAGGTPKLTFTIENLGESAVGDFSFSDDLNAVIPGLTAIGLPASGVCGAGSQLAGTSILTFSGGNLGAGGLCTFEVLLQVPLNAAPGTFTNVTSDLLVAGTPGASPAVDSITVVPPPDFDKTFTPDGIPLTGTSTLSFSINNSASPLGATGLTFTDNLPAGITVAAPPNASTMCTGGILTAAAGSSVIAYSGGAVAAGASCSVQVDVTSVLSGSHLNVSGDLTSLLGNSGPASATLISQIMLMGGPFTPGPNTLTTSKGLSDAIIVLVKGTQPGSKKLTVQGVTVTTAFADPVVVAFAEAGVDGSASFVLNATEAQVGQTLQFQAFQILPIVDASVVLSVPVVDAPLLAAGGQAVLALGESAGANALTPVLLRSVVATAIERWEGMGLTQAEIDLLHSITVRIADLPAGLLGQLVGTTISIDYSAADYGWFVDETPGDGAEFGAALSQTERGAHAGGPADQRMDLYTAVLHEFGHVLKFEDSSPHESLRGVMTAELPTGIRRLPTGWQNPSRILDVNDDGSVSPIDALIIINEVNAAKFRDSAGRLPNPVPQLATRWFFDTNGDGFATALDALRIFNHLNNNMTATAVAESEAPPHVVDLALLGLQTEQPLITAPAPRQTVSVDNANRDARLVVRRNDFTHATERELQFAASDAKSAESDLALLEWLEQQSSGDC
jgi:hypothetical protein